MGETPEEDDNIDLYKPKLDRFWDKKWEAYVLKKGPEPPKHSDPKHPWNIDKEKYKLKMGMK